MPKLKQQKWREELAATMRAAKKRKNLIAIESSLTDGLHWDSLKKIVCSNTRCSRCGSEVTLQEKTVGIATQVGLTCTNQRCSLKGENKENRTKFTKHNFRTDSNESFAVNCQLVLSIIQMGTRDKEYHQFIYARRS